jgi:hypothetical protein
MSLHHKSHFYKPDPRPLGTWEYEYVRWMRSRDDVRKFFDSFRRRK